MKRLFPLALAAGCATGVGEAATGTVELSVLPAGDASGGVRFDRALLSVAGVELIAAAEVEAPDDDHDHGHSHLVVRAIAAAPLEAAVVDLLAAEQSLGSVMQPASTYEAAHVALAPLATGEGADCSLFATGSATLEEQAVPVRICLPGGLEVDVELHLDVGHDETTPLRFVFAVNGVLQNVALAALERDAGGIVRIDAAHNAGVLETLRANVSAALSVAD